MRKLPAEWKVTDIKVTGLATTDRSTLIRLALAQQVLMEDHDGLGFWLSVHTELLSQLAEPYASVSQKPLIIREKIAQLKNEVFSLSERMGQYRRYLRRHYNVVQLTQTLLHLSTLGSKLSIRRAFSSGYGTLNGYSD